MSEKTIGCIYLITNLENGKKYVGQTKYPTPDKRWKSHVKSAKVDKKPYLLYNAIRKYGEDCFKVETLTVCEYDSLENLEAYYAEQYGTYCWDSEPGYNMTWCTRNFRLGIPHTEKAREKLRLINTGRKASEETREKMSKSQCGKKRSEEKCLNIKNGKLNNPISEEGIKNIIESKLGKKMSKEARDNMRKSRANKKEINPESGDNKIKKKFNCEYKDCDKILSSKASLKLHIRTHTGEKPFKCSKCPKAFACGSNLDEHMYSHSDTKEFKCKHCDCEYTHERSLKEHNLKQHNS